MSTLIIRDVSVVNEGKIFTADVSIENKKISKISNSKIQGTFDQEINGKGMHLYRDD